MKVVRLFLVASAFLTAVAAYNGWWVVTAVVGSPIAIVGCGYLYGSYARFKDKSGQTITDD